MSEANLVALARQGDAAAWEQLVRAHQAPVFRLAYLLLGDEDDAEDAAQETFIRAYHSLHGFDATRPLKPWLLAIARNQARNRGRSLGRYLAAMERLLRAGSGVRSSHTDVYPSHQAQSQALHQAIRRLRRRDQEIIYLRYFLEMNEAETAATLGVAAGTVKSRLHRALHRLRTLVEEEFPVLREEHLP